MGRKHKRGNGYKQRNERLKELGFADYAAYQKSDIWAGIRERVLARDCKKCRLCKEADANSCHHNSYSMAALKGEDISQIYAICDKCHVSIEFKHNGRKDLDFWRVVDRCNKKLACVETPKTAPTCRPGVLHITPPAEPAKRRRRQRLRWEKYKADNGIVTPHIPRNDPASIAERIRLRKLAESQGDTAA